MREITSKIRKALISPNWYKTDKCHDWKNHIPQEIKDEWDDLTTEAQFVAYIIAKEQADKEEWE